MSWHFSKFFQRVRGYLFEETGVAIYKPIVYENTLQKVIRIYEDKSFFAQKKKYMAEEHKEMHQNQSVFLLRIFQMFFSKKKCNNPCGIKILFWYFIVFWAILYFFLEVGILLTFGQTLWDQYKQSNDMLIANIIFLLILYIDVVVQFRTGYLSRGMIIRQRERVIAHYLRFHFILDMIVLIVLTVGVAINDFGINYAKCIVILKFTRIYEFDQLYLRRLAVNRVLKMLYVIWQQIVIIFVLSHIIGVIYYWIDFALIETTCQPPNEDLCWLYSSGAYSPIISLPWDLQYFYIIYWGVSTITTISYGDIASNNPYETIYCTFMMCVGFGVYAYIVNSIIKVILWARSKSDKIKSQMIIIDGYMKELSIDKDLKEDVREYLMFLYNEEKDRDKELQQELKAKLPQDLRLQLVKSAYSNVYQSLQYMLELGSSVGKLLFNIKQQLFTANQQVLVQDSVIDHLSFMYKGEVSLQCNFNQNLYTITTFTSANQYIAQGEFFMREKIRYTVVAQRSSNFYFISRDIFQQECIANPIFKESLRYLEYSINISKKFIKILYLCPYCQKGHRWNECPDKFVCLNDCRLTNSTKSKQEGLNARMRGPRQKHHTLYHRKRLYELEILRKLNEDDFYGKIGKRLMKIRDKLQTKQNFLEVDVAHDWSIYLPDQNLSRLRELVNEKKIYKRISRLSSLRRTQRINIK